jgi:hypothetical protein
MFAGVVVVTGVVRMLVPVVMRPMIVALSPLSASAAS